MAEPAPGFFGKAPAFGDFLSRGMPTVFLPAWDAWLQAVMTESRARLKGDWLSAWLGMPVWHFGFGPGLIGPGRAFGVLIPSVDRVGRHFPFSILGQAASAAPRWSTGRCASRHWRSTRSKTGSTRHGYSPTWPSSGRRPNPAGPKTAPIFGWKPLDEIADWPPEIEPALAGLTDGETLFWCRGAGRVVGSMLRSAGLPAEQQAAVLVAGGA